MGASKTPEPITPGEAAQAAVGTAAAGEMMSVANQPVDQYGNLVNVMQLGPAQMQTQQALMNRAALQGARAQMDVQSRIDPQAYAQRQMRMNAANQRLGKLYNVNPNAISFGQTGNAYNVPQQSDLPDLGQLTANARAIASRLSTGAVNKSGTNPTLNPPNYARDLPYPGLTGNTYY